MTTTETPIVPHVDWAVLVVGDHHAWVKCRICGVMRHGRQESTFDECDAVRFADEHRSCGSRA